MEKNSIYSRHAPIPSYSKKKKIFFFLIFYFKLTERRICFAFRFDIISKAVNDCSAISIEVILRN